MEIKDDYLVYVFVFIGWKDGLVVEFYVERRNYGLSGYCKHRIKRHDVQDIIFLLAIISRAVIRLFSVVRQRCFHRDRQDDRALRLRRLRLRHRRHRPHMAPVMSIRHQSYDNSVSNKH